MKCIYHKAPTDVTIYAYQTSCPLRPLLQCPNFTSTWVNAHLALCLNRLVVASNRKSLLRDCENRWIVCSSSHQSSNGDIRASASVPLSVIILRTEAGAGGSIRGIFLTDEKCLLPYSLKYIISSSLVSYKSHHIKYGSLCTVCNNMETSGSQ